MPTRNLKDAFLQIDEETAYRDFQLADFNFKISLFTE